MGGDERIVDDVYSSCRRTSLRSMLAPVQSLRSIHDSQYLIAIGFNSPSTNPFNPL